MKASVGILLVVIVIAAGVFFLRARNPEGFARLCESLGRNRLGYILDIVPNHMSIAGRENAWWWDVLENGQSSRYASYFDVDWQPLEAKLHDTVLMPVLGDHYGRVLEAGELKLRRDGGTFTLNYHEHVMPIAPRSVSPAPVRRFPQERLSDAELVNAIIQGDGDAVGVVWDRYSSLVRGVLRSSLGFSADTEDMLQEVFIAFLRGVHRLRSAESLRAYLVGVAVRRVMGELRRRRKPHFIQDTAVRHRRHAAGRRQQRAIHRQLDGPRSMRSMRSIRRY